MEMYERSEMLFGLGSTEKLRSCRVAIFGIGGVGGAALEAIARAGVGEIDLIDSDTVSVTNKNRQLVATDSTVGLEKTEAARRRVYDIDPAIKVNVHNVFYLPENADSFDFSKYDYVVDCIDTVSGKISIIVKSQEAGVPCISSMGTGNKVHPEMLEVADIYKTSVCPLARVMRAELKKCGIKKLKVVYSKEEPLKPCIEMKAEGEGRRSVPGSCSFVPPVAGYIIASVVIRDLLEIKKTIYL